MHLQPAQFLVIEAFNGYDFGVRFTGEQSAVSGTWLTRFGPALIDLDSIFSPPGAGHVRTTSP